MERQKNLLNWIQASLEDDDCYIKSASSDASFRSYWRVYSKGKKYIAMDAPPEFEDCKPFITIAKQLNSIDVNSPEVLHQDLTSGFLLLTDLGNTHYLDILNNENYQDYYSDAINCIHKTQLQYDCKTLPLYDQQLLENEISLFKEWFINKHLGVDLNDEQTNVYQKTIKILVENALEQPQKFVHRDFHSRNLMTSKSNNPAVIDFQDAVKGPITYDLVSLLRDCYISWGDDKIYPLVENFREKFNQTYKTEFDNSTFTKWFDLMGFQRHMKAIGIFCRLNYRDNKSQYLKDIPTTLSYLNIISKKYDELSGFNQILENICPSLIKICKP